MEINTRPNVYKIHFLDSFSPVSDNPCDLPTGGKQSKVSYFYQQIICKAESRPPRAFRVNFIPQSERKHNIAAPPVCKSQTYSKEHAAVRGALPVLA